MIEKQYRPDIDGLRAISVLAVMAFHFFPEKIRGGFIGVDVFFVISGYLIAGILLENIQNNRFQFGAFYVRRIIRIFPALLLMLLTLCIIGWFVLLPYEYISLGKHITTGTLMVPNIRLWMETGYFDRSAELKPLLHLWSLGVEEQFYLFFPLLLWAATKCRAGFTIIILAVAAVASFALNLWLVGSDTAQAFYSPLTRAWEPFCGALLAASRTNNPVRPILAVLMVIAGIILLGVSILTINASHAFPGWRAFFPVMAAVLIIQAGQDNPFSRNILANRLLVGVGLISYPLYLWHWPLLSIARTLEGQNIPTELKLLIAALSFLLSYLTYLLLEKPVRHVRKKIQVAIVLLISMFTTGLLGYWIVHANGFPSRFPQENTAIQFLSSYPHPYNIIDPRCRSFISDEDQLQTCLISRPENPTVVIVGDSHSAQYYLSLKKYLPEESVLVITRPACLPFTSNKLPCGDTPNRIANYLASTPSIKTVYLAGFWTYLSSGSFKFASAEWRIPELPDASEQESFREHAKIFISKLTESNKKVLLINDTPYLDFLINDCFDTRPVRINPRTERSCGIDISSRANEIRVMNNLLSSILGEFPAVNVFDPSTVLCKDNYCRAAQDGKPIYFNSDHLTEFGADIITRSLLEQYPDSRRHEKTE